jgi:hypothetical protein
MDHLFGEHAADGVRSLVPLLLDGVEDLFLLRLIGEAKGRVVMSWSRVISSLS